MYELSVLAHSCRASEADGAGGYEYASWRCRQLCERLEAGYVDMDDSSWNDAVYKNFPLA